MDKDEVMEEIIIEHIVMPILQRDIYPHFSKEEIEFLFQDITLDIPHKDKIIVKHGYDFNIVGIDPKNKTSYFMDMKNIIAGIEKYIGEWEIYEKEALDGSDQYDLETTNEALALYRQLHQKIIDLSARAKKI